MTHFKRVFELNPGEHFLYFGHEFIVTKIENGFIYYSSPGRTNKKYGSFGWKSLQQIEVIPNNKKQSNEQRKERKTDTNTPAV